MAYYFTREEAEALLPDVSMILRRIQATSREIQTLEETLNGLRMQSLNNGHHLQDRIVHVRRDLAKRLQALQADIGELHSLGCELKDPELGLVDFLSLRDGHEVYLCWHLGEDRIRYWHELNGGFAGRHPLDG
jgi:hypothetical protein